MKRATLLLLPSILLAQGANFSLGTSAIVVGGAGGSASVELAAPSPTATWTAVSNAAWLHLAPASTAGTGSSLIQFTCDANPNNAPQTGTLTIAGLTVTVTQAGNGFVPTSALTTVLSQGLISLMPWH
jgi:hypothetical protein